MVAALATAALIAAVVVVPLTARGWLLLVDWVPGPHDDASILDPGAETGIPTSPLQSLLVGALRSVVGAATTGWLVLALILIGAGAAMALLVGGPARRRVPAAVLYMVNPVVYERAVIGQFGFLLAYAVLPVAVAAVLDCVERRHVRWSDAALLSGAAIAFSVHAAWILAALLLFTPLVVRSARSAMALVAAGVGTVLTQLYLVLPTFAGTPTPSIGKGDLTAFATRADPNFGVLGNVLTLYGFWRIGPPLPKYELPGWPLLQVALLLIIAAGVAVSLREGIHRRRVLVLLGGAAACAFLACGTWGPTGPAFVWLFEHVPGFSVMREPQKFVAGVALFYAMAFGLGTERLVGAPPRAKAAALVAMCCAIPLAATPTLLWGFGGQVRPVRAPASWAAADRAMGAGDGKILFLPWHQYLSFPFTGRVTANPGNAFFRKRVISGTNAEVPGVAESEPERSSYLQLLFRSGPEICSFGDHLGPLGVEFVALAKTLEWESFGWLNRQVDLEMVFDSREITVYRNLRFRGTAWRAAGTAVARDLVEVAALSKSGTLSEQAVSVANPVPPGAVAQDGCEPPPGQPPRDGVVSISPGRIALEPAPPGVVVVTESFDESWSAAGGKPLPIVGNATAVPTGDGARHMVLGRVKVVRVGFLLAAAAGLVLAFIRAGKVIVVKGRHKP